MEELLEERLLNEANFRGKCLGVVWDLIRKLKTPFNLTTFLRLYFEELHFERQK